MFIKQQWNDYSNYFDLKRERGMLQRDWDRGKEIALIMKKKKKFILLGGILGTFSQYSNFILDCNALTDILCFQYHSHIRVYVSSLWTFEALLMLYCNNSKSAQKIKSDFDIVDKWIANNTSPNPLYVLSHLKKLTI